MRLTVIGSSPSWPDPGEAHSGYLVEGPGRLLIDCGPGVLSRLRELEPPWPAIDAIVISHFHLDHFGDLVPWVWGSIYGPGRDAKRPELYLHPGGREYLADLAVTLGGRAEMFERAFELREYADAVSFEAGGFGLLPRRVEHYDCETYGFRVSDGRATLAYSADSAPVDALVELARDVDLFLCEATLAAGEPEPRGHLSLREAEAVFAASGARRLLVTHRAAELPTGDEIERAAEGLELEL